ncbi:hypothetical protein ACWD0A_27875 [Streptomyces sp. NPDC002867]
MLAEGPKAVALGADAGQVLLLLPAPGLFGVAGPAGDCLAGLDEGIEEVLEAGVLVGELVAPKSCSVASAPMVGFPSERRGAPIRSRITASGMAWISAASAEVRPLARVVGQGLADDPGEIGGPLLAGAEPCDLVSSGVAIVGS